MTETDTVVFALPVGFKVENIPDEVLLESRFGNYHAGISFTDSTLIFTRAFTIFKSDRPPEDYEELYGFLSAINKADNMKAVAIRQN